MGGGLNISEKGGALGTHIDGNYNDQTGLNRRLNAIIYLTKDWKKKYGGTLGLYNSNGKKLIKSIEPKFNRLIIFNTNDYSYHGITDKVNYPKTNPRKSIILYFYTKAKRKKSETKISKPHSALWVKKNYKDAAEKMIKIIQNKNLLKKYSSISKNNEKKKFFSQHIFKDLYNLIDQK